ncbi:hypothetical protein F5Y05DRAFT_409940 [Hypoxylon sp. FL0543]|nr:hypothetical protein F5Y05DRAFT_409940 [Hypoxylon sp. FL0543]
MRSLGTNTVAVILIRVNDKSNFSPIQTDSTKSSSSHSATTNLQLTTTTQIDQPTKPTNQLPSTTPANMPLDNPTTTNKNQDSGVTGAAKFVTSTVGNAAGGVGRTAGNVVGAAGRGLGDTITSATGSAGKPVGDALGSVGTGVQSGADSVSKGVENAGQWKQ